MLSIKKDLLCLQGKLTPEQRVNAFCSHSRLLTELYEAGRSYRKNGRAQRLKGKTHAG